MNTSSLRGFAARILESNRIGREDVRRLQQDILADGIVSRDEAEILIGLDRDAQSIDPAFADYLVAAIVDFAVWGSRPTGYVDRDTAQWLAAALSNGGATATRIAREIVREAEAVDAALLAFAMIAPKRPQRPAATELAA